jgi:hypothetical protein
MRMDVLEYWSPTIDWSGFKQGALSDKAWALLRQLVQLSHAHGHWAETAHRIRLSPPPPSIYGKESNYQRNKRKHHWEREIERAEGHMHRAAYLGADKIAQLSYLITAADEGRPDWVLYLALFLAVAYQPNHTLGRYKAAAFSAFDADLELADNPEAIAMRWLGSAGLAGQAA